jgi:hypothetical protein
VKQECEIQGFLQEEYGKYPELDDMIIMEYEPFTGTLIDNLPYYLEANQDFVDWL